jgi:EAL domain-containing protein (putative c-di-GMP-specific phosphodiesterase class I)
MKGGNEKIFRPDVIFLKMPRSKLGRTLDVAVVAEGVETQDQADALLAIGCRAVQGFYFARCCPSTMQQIYFGYRENDRMLPVGRPGATLSMRPAATRTIVTGGSLPTSVMRAHHWREFAQHAGPLVQILNCPAL